MIRFCLAAAFLAAAPLAAQQPSIPNPLTLAQAINLGRERGVTAALARVSARAAENRIGLRRADLLPNIGGSAGVARQTVNLDEFGIAFASGVTDPFTLFRFQLRAAQTVFDPAAFARLKTARDSAVAAGLDARVAGALAGATAGVAYLRALSTQETVQAREADSAIAAQLLDQATQLLNAGITPAIDRTRSEVNLAAVRSQLAIARNQRDRTRLDLSRALDLPSSTPLELAGGIELETGGLPATRDAAVGYALGHRSELAAEERRLAVMQQSRKAIRAENLPSVGASGSYTESGRGTGTLASTYLLQVGVTVPVLDGFRRQIRSREEGLRIEAQQIRLHDLRLAIEAEVQQALLDVGSATEQLALANERTRLAQQELDQAGDRFRAGVAGSIETTNAQGGLIAARDAVIQARVAVGVARVSLLKALGNLEDGR